ncbi:MAG: M23 family metallopeptidase, partial [Caldilineaceae bacterium]|nr:M23 family metallopeptidase [Caldilineaceae bacterium]
ATTTAAAPAAAATINGQEVVTPALYAECYRLCRAAIHQVAGHEDDQVLIAAVAPWNNQTIYAGNPTGDWVQYFADVLTLLGPDGCDGITLHTYTHQADPNLITSETRMNPPFTNRRFEFRAYQDFMAAVPAPMRDLPVYITETNQDVAWLDRNIAWVQRAYGEINWWNQQAGNQKIRALVLYRYPPIDRWVIQGKGGVIEDFKMALQSQYRWRVSPPPVIAAGAVVVTTDLVNLRRTAGYVNKSSNDVLWQMPVGTEATILAGPETKDGLVWWQIRINSGERAGLTGYTAQATGTGQSLLRVVQEAPSNGSGGSGSGGSGGSGGGTGGGNASGDFTTGDTVKTTTVVRMRRTAGYVNKPASDVVADIPAGTELTILGGPTTADGLTWWRLRSKSNAAHEGWMAQSTNGVALLTKVTGGDTVEPPKGTFTKGDRIVTTTVVRMRKSPGYTNKLASDVVADIAQGVEGTVQDGPRSADSLTWWQVNTTAPNGTRVTGWMAEVGPNGITLLTKATAAPPPPPPATGLAAGDIVSAIVSVRLRNTPGYLNKPSDDVLGDFRDDATVNIIAGARTADNLTWWQVGGILSSGEEGVGWAAEKGPTGTVLIAAPPVLPGTSIPNKATKSYLGQPYQGNFGIAQLWGENPQIYSSITYDGVPLIGHNGIDFLTPTGTPILAVDNGVIEQAVYNDPTGFGHFVKVRHSWGEALYAHLSKIDVQVGQQVVRGNKLGETGNTGFTFGPHLHFAIRINPYSRTDGWGGFSDPLPYLNPASITLPDYVLGKAAARSVAQSAAGDQSARPAAEALAAGSGYAPDALGKIRP